MSTTTGLGQTPYSVQVGIPTAVLKPKKVRRRLDLTLWEKLYVAEIVRGLVITSKHFFINMIGFIFPPAGKKRKVFTVYYPEEKLDLPPAYRGRPVLVADGDGKERCVACGLCEKMCPAHAISIVAAEKAPGERYPARYTLDMGRCVYCGYCEEVCPKEAIVMSDEYQGLAQRDRTQLRFEKEQLLRPEGKVKTRLYYVRRIYSKWNY